MKISISIVATVVGLTLGNNDGWVSAYTMGGSRGGRYLFRGMPTTTMMGYRNMSPEQRAEFLRQQQDFVNRAFDRIADELDKKDSMKWGKQRSSCRSRRGGPSTCNEGSGESNREVRSSSDVPEGQQQEQDLKAFDQKLADKEEDVLQN